MLYLDYLAHHNALSHISIGEKLLLAGGGLLLALLINNPVTLVAIIVTMHLVMLYARIPIGYIRRLWIVPLAFLAVGAASIALSFSKEAFSALLIINFGGVYIGITAEGLSGAERILLRSAAAISCLLMLASTTPVAHIVGFLARFPGLRIVGEVALLTYRFLFVFLAAAGQIYTAQQSRLGYINNRKTINSLALMAANVGRKTFLSSRDLNIALQARNFSGNLSYTTYQFSAKPWRLAAISAVLFAITLTAAL